jgi:hypothetical protein
MIHLGMLSLHFEDTNQFKRYEWNNQLIGISYSGFNVATFLNSFGRRSYSLFWERDVFFSNREPWRHTFGWAIGLLYGYKNGEAFILSKYSPILPTPSFYYCCAYKRIGIRLSLTADILSFSSYFTY